MKDEFKVLYVHGFIPMGAVRQAVMDGALTPEDYKEITGDNYE